MRTPLNNIVKLRLSDEQLELARNLSHRHNVSIAEAIRVCLDHYVILDTERADRHHKDNGKKKGARPFNRSGSPL